MNIKNGAYAPLGSACLLKVPATQSMDFAGQVMPPKEVLHD